MSADRSEWELMRSFFDIVLFCTHRMNPYITFAKNKIKMNGFLSFLKSGELGLK